MENKYYNPEIILSKKDINGNEPSIYIITSNRSAGKTTAFLIKALQNFSDNGKQFILLYRYNYELSSACDIFKDVLTLYPTFGNEMEQLSHARGLFYELLLDNNSCGYAISLNNVDALKKYSPLFADVDMIIFDEFMTESGKYLSKETQKLQSILMTIARGGGSQSRHIKLFMLANNVSLLNPYFIEFGIHERLQPNTRFLRGDGFIAEFNYNETASKEIQSNPLFTPFKHSNYMNYSTDKQYLINTSMFIEKMSGKSSYLYTIVYDNQRLGVRLFNEDNILYVSHSDEPNCKRVITLKANDHDTNTIIVKKHSSALEPLHHAFNYGYLRFDDLRTKSIILEILGIDLYR